MARARTWFDLTNTNGLSKEDLVIMNRAARWIDDGGHEMTHRVLMEIRTKYQPGKSAQDLIDDVEDMLGVR